MYRRYRDYRQRRRRTTDRRPRSVLKRPGVQISILIIVALIIYIILQSSGGAGNSLPHENGAGDEIQSSAFVLDVRTAEQWNKGADVVFWG